MQEVKKLADSLRFWMFILSLFMIFFIGELLYNERQLYFLDNPEIILKHPLYSMEKPYENILDNDNLSLRRFYVKFDSMKEKLKVQS